MKVCPTVEELMPGDFACSVDNCTETFTTHRAYRFHRVKVHKLHDDGLEKNGCGKQKMKAEFHCPVEGCIKSEKSGRFFTTFKYLKQHYIKVHMDRNLICGTCGKAFPVHSLLRQHQQNCSRLFQCGSCDAVYPSKEALQTHCRRHTHKLILDDEHIADTRNINSTEAEKCGELSQPVSSVDAVHVTTEGQTQQPIKPVHPAHVTTVGKSQQPIKPVHSEHVTSPEKSHQPIKSVDSVHVTSPQPIRTAGSLNVTSLDKSKTTQIESQAASIILPSRISGAKEDVNRPKQVHILPKTDTILVSMNSDSGPAILLMGGLQPVKEVRTGLRPLAGKPVAHCITHEKQADNVQLTPLRLQTSETQTVNKESIAVGPDINDIRSCVQSRAVQVKPTKRNMVAQTTGDYILQKAMECAEIPVHSKKSEKNRSRKLKSSETQTGPVAKRSKKSHRESGKKSSKVATATTVMTCPALPKPITTVDQSALIDDLNDLLTDFNDTETQTTIDWEALQGNMAESNYTQTVESFLAGSWNAGSLQTSETQTAPTALETHTQSLPDTPVFHNQDVLLSEGAAAQTVATTSNVYSQCVETQTSLASCTFPEFLPAVDASTGTELMNMETQTMNDVIEDLFNHMETQTTTDDILTELGLAHIETQTTLSVGPGDDFDSMNVETQTSIHAFPVTANTHGNDMETQTFFPREMCDAGQLTDSHTQTSLHDLEQLMANLE